MAVMSFVIEAIGRAASSLRENKVVLLLRSCTSTTFERTALIEPAVAPAAATPAVVLARIQARIEREIGVTVSVGLSHNKFLAKMASDLNKPNGQAVITPKNGPAFVEQLAVKTFHGVGPATAEKMQAVH